MRKEGTKKPSKSRKKRYNAPSHVRQKFIAAPLSPSLRAEHGTRSMRVVEGDTVIITKGDRKLSEGDVIRVDPGKNRVYLEGVTRTRMDGSTVQIPIRPNNVMITELDLEDDWRKKILERKSFSQERE